MDRRHFGLAFATALLIASPAIAQEPVPAKADKMPQSQAEQVESLGSPDAPVQLAERADAEQPPLVKRPRAARVTTCRCGDPSAQ